MIDQGVANSLRLLGIIAGRIGAGVALIGWAWIGWKLGRDSWRRRRIRRHRAAVNVARELSGLPPLPLDGSALFASVEEYDAAFAAWKRERTGGYEKIFPFLRNRP